MADDLAPPVPPETPPPLAERDGDTGGRRFLRRRPVFIGFGALVAAVALALLVVHFVTGGSAVRSELARSAEKLRDAPALHYTGTINVKGSGDWRLDLVISNTGDARGTLNSSDGAAFDYLGIDGKSFLRGDAAAWQALGMVDRASGFAEKPQLAPPGLFSHDLAAFLAPPALAKTVRLEQVPDEKITEGDPVAIGDHSCTPVHADGTTICLSAERTGGARFVDRIAFPGASVDIAAMSRDEVNGFYGRFREKLTLAREAVNPRITVTVQTLRAYHGECSATSCTSTGRVTVTLLDDLAVAAKTAPVQVNYSWDISRDGVSVPVGPECSGAVLIKPHSSTNLTCTATGSPVPAGGPTNGQFNFRLHTSDVALTTAEYERMMRLAADNARRVSALPDLPSPR